MANANEKGSDERRASNETELTDVRKAHLSTPMPYRTPRLRYLGSVKELTATTSVGLSTDGVGFKTSM